MDKIVRVVVDGMGGDNAPACTIEAVVNALNEKEGFEVIMTGDEETLKKGLSSYNYPADRLTIRHTTEVIEMAESPVLAIRKKRDSSIVVGMSMVKKGEADGFVSAGSSGAILVGGQLLVGRLKGVQRPPLSVIVPTQNGMTCVVDCGANVDASPEWLVQFARMGSIYSENMLGIKNPTVGLLNIGAEEEKGNALVKETMPLLKACTDINFVGSVEARDVPSGAVDVVVTDAFAGNVLLKMYEGTSLALLKIIKQTLKSSLKTMIGGALIKDALKETLSTYDASNYGGAPLLGLNGLVVKAHGNSGANEIKNSIFQCIDFYEKDINNKIKNAMKAAESAD